MQGLHTSCTGCVVITAYIYTIHCILPVHNIKSTVLRVSLIIAIMMTSSSIVESKPNQEIGSFIAEVKMR